MPTPIAPRNNQHRATVRAAAAPALVNRKPFLLLLLTIALTILVQLALVAPVQAQYPSYPRLGLSAAPDRFELDISVHGDETFELHVVVLPPEGETVHAHDYSYFEWAVLEACCGGAAVILDEDYNPQCQSDGTSLGGIQSVFDECQGGEVIHLATLTLQMAIDQPGIYWIIAGPLDAALTCDGQPVVMTDMLVNVHYTTDVTPVESSSWSGVKNLFR
jgi:hypothetical protein